jgi:nucleoid-associated protein YgaU
MEAPQPLRPVAPPPRPAETPAATAAPPAANPLYRVRQNGEMFWQIAQRTLPDPNRWWDIHFLNKQFNPEQLVPGGSVLRLPVGARVPRENQP